MSYKREHTAMNTWCAVRSYGISLGITGIQRKWSVHVVIGVLNVRTGNSSTGGCCRPCRTTYKQPPLSMVGAPPARSSPCRRTERAGLQASAESSLGSRSA
jgi:hypothetical protein